MTRLAWFLTALLLGCGSGVPVAVGSVEADAATDASAGRLGTATDSAGHDGAADGVGHGTRPPDTVGAGSTPLQQAVQSHWVQRVIGNCIDFEEWLTFGAQGAFTHTLVNRDFCGPHSVTVSPGKWQLASGGHGLDYEWQAQGSKTRRQHTVALVDPYAVTFPVEPEPGYVPGQRALMRAAYIRKGIEPVYWREDRLQQTGTDAKTYTTDRSLAVEIAFAAPLQPGPTAKPCTMQVKLSIAATHGPDYPLVAGTENWTLPCSYGPDATTPGWVRITANGFENPYDGAWMAFLEQKKVWTKYPSYVSNVVYDEFRPILYFQANRPLVLFHGTPGGTWSEMLSPPPATVP